MIRIKRNILGNILGFSVVVGLCSCFSKPQSEGIALPQDIDTILHAGILYDGGTIAFDFKDKGGLFWIVSFNHSIKDKLNKDVYETLSIRNKTNESDSYSLPVTLKAGGEGEKEILSMFDEYLKKGKSKDEHQRLIKILLEDVSLRDKKQGLYAPPMA